MNLCSVDGCEKDVSARGYCATHYQRWWRHGDVTVTLTRPNGSPPREHCEIEGCSKVPAPGARCCHMHYKRMYRASQKGISPTPEALREYEVKRALKTLDRYGLVSTLRLAKTGRGGAA